MMSRAMQHFTTFSQYDDSIQKMSLNN